MQGCTQLDYTLNTHYIHTAYIRESSVTYIIAMIYLCDVFKQDVYNMLTQLLHMICSNITPFTG